jgi:hypothetical protein
VYQASIEVNTGENTGWQQMGTWGVDTVHYPPVNISVSPSSGTGTSQTFQFTTSSPDSYADIGNILVIFNSSLTAVNGCYLYYTQASNWISLANDANTAWIGAGHLGSYGTIGNDQCQLNLAASSFSGSGDTGALSLAMTFLGNLAGQQNIYQASIEVNTGESTGWQQMGTWTINYVAPPTTITSYNNSARATWTGITVYLDGGPNSGGSACTTPCTITDGRAHSIQMPSPGTLPSGGAGSEVVFNSWSDGAANPHTIQPGASVTAAFTVYYQFTGNANPSNGG